jgi:hypothetical protein
MIVGDIGQPTSATMGVAIQAAADATAAGSGASTIRDRFDAAFNAPILMPL